MADTNGWMPVVWRNECVSRIMLGTVQLGMDYGVANRQGQPSASQALAIVKAAWEHGIRHFDTAQAYGNSESVLGNAFRALGIAEEVAVTSKLSTQLDPLDASGVAASIESTFARLGIQRVWCMMLHAASWLDSWDRGLGGVLRTYRDAGRIQHLGVSLNSPNEAARCLDHPDMDIMQIACNAWDRRMVRLNVFERARAKGTLCCVRSIYLKGLLTLSPDEVAVRMPFAREPSTRWHALSSRYGIPVTELAVRFAVGLDTPLVVGAETPEQIADTVRLAHKGPLLPELMDDLARELDPVLNDVILTPHDWDNLAQAELDPRS